MSSKTIIEWLLSDTLHLHGAEELLAEFAPRLADVANVNFISLDIYTVRCEVAVRNLIWQQGQALQAKMLSPHEAEARFVDNKAMCLKHKNCVILPMYFTRGKHTHVAYASRKKQGFSDNDLKVLHSTTPALARRLEIESYHHFYGFSSAIENFWKRVSERCREVDKTQETR